MQAAHVSRGTPASPRSSSTCPVASPSASVKCGQASACNAAASTSACTASSRHLHYYMMAACTPVLLSCETRCGTLAWHERYCPVHSHADLTACGKSPACMLAVFPKHSGSIGPSNKGGRPGLTGWVRKSQLSRMHLGLTSGVLPAGAKQRSVRWQAGAPPARTPSRPHSLRLVEPADASSRPSVTSTLCLCARQRSLTTQVCVVRPRQY